MQTFLCDEMLQRLGRWLRAAGYDTAIAVPGEDDRTLVLRACSEKRLLLTRDREMAKRRSAKDCVALLESNALTSTIAEVSKHYAVNWLIHPFSRCLECNTVLVPANDKQRQLLPDGALRISNEAWFCPTCNKLYWEGSHVRRMRHTLENFSNSLWVIAPE